MNEMRTTRPAAPRLLLVVPLAIALRAAPVFNVADFGAKGDGVYDDTKAVRAAFAAAAASGPSTVLFPANHVWLTGAFNLSSNLVVDIQGTILAWPGSEDGHYVLAPDLPWFSFDLKWQAFIHSYGANNITLLGGGAVDGNGKDWWACGCHGNPPPPLSPTNKSAPCLAYERPKLFNPVNGTGLRVSNLTFRNSPMWHMRPSWFNDVVFQNITVEAPPNPYSCNTDGIDPDATQDMLVLDSRVSVGDDAIAVKSGYNWFGRTFGRPSRNITFRNMRIGTGHGVSVGSEMSGGVEDLLFENFVLNGTGTGPRVKSERGRGGVIANVTFRNFTLFDVGSAFQVTEYYIDPPPPTNATATPHFYNITIDGLTIAPGSNTKDGAYLNGLPESIIQGVVLKDVDLRGAATPMSDCQYTQGVCEGTVLPSCPPCLTPSGR